MSNLEESILQSESELVALNTRIPRKLSAKINIAVGILQTTHNVLAFSKQSAVQVLLMRGFQSLYDDFEKGILGDSESIAPIQNHVSEGFEDPPNFSEGKAMRAINLNYYKEISNK